MLGNKIQRITMYSLPMDTTKGERKTMNLICPVQSYGTEIKVKCKPKKCQIENCPIFGIKLPFVSKLAGDKQ